MAINTSSSNRSNKKKTAMEFCPWCANMLQLDPPGNGHGLRFACPTCPYVCPVANKIVRRQRFPKKEVEPIFSYSESMKFAQKTTSVSCPQCHHGEAAYVQRQLRSADEPMTTFYSCCNENCQHTWRED